MPGMQTVHATARYQRAIEAIIELLGKLNLGFAFVGNVARAAWLNEPVADGSLDVLVLMNAQQKNQLVMMASNHGFGVDRDALERSEELDLIPLTLSDSEGELRIHVLLASNALYGRMLADARPAEVNGHPIKVPAPEALAILLTLAEDEMSRQALMARQDFDHDAFKERLVSIGLGRVVGTASARCADGPANGGER